MFYTVKCSILIIAFCYFVTSIHKLIKILQDYNYGITEDSIIKDTNNLTEEEFKDLVLNICAINNVKNLNLIGENIYECYIENNKFLLFFNNEKFLFEEEYLKVVYGYSLIIEIKGIIIITVSHLQESFKETLRGLSNKEVIYFTKDEYYKEKFNSIIN